MLDNVQKKCQLGQKEKYSYFQNKRKNLDKFCKKIMVDVQMAFVIL